MDDVCEFCNPEENPLCTVESQSVCPFVPEYRGKKCIDGKIRMVRLKGHHCENHRYYGNPIMAECVLTHKNCEFMKYPRLCKRFIEKEKENEANNK